MKKEKKKTTTQKKRSDAERKTELNDLGLEPPKIYRDTTAYKKQQDLAKRSRERKNAPKNAPKKKTQRKAEEDNLTRTERRELQSKKRKRKNAIRKLFTWFIIAVTILGVGVVLSLTVFFKISAVNVEGNERYSTEEILSQCTIDVGENLFMSDTKNAKEMLERNLPYIYNAEIKRKLPDKIVINITEVEPAYYITNEDGTFILLDDNFKVLETAGETSSGMEIKDAEYGELNIGHRIEFTDENVADCLAQLAGIIKEKGFDKFTAISSTGLNNNYLVYDGRITFKLGTMQDLEKKIFQGLATCEELDETSPNVEGEITLNGGKQIYFTEK